MFPWQNAGPPPAGAQPQGAAAPPPPSFGGPPAAGFGGPPISAEQALQGFGEGAIDLRDPFLPVGFAGEVSLIATKGDRSLNVGTALYIRVRVEQIAEAGGGATYAKAAEGVSNANLSPAAIGNVHAIRINGFDKPKARAFAISDMKLFLIALLSYTGLTQQTPVTPSQWDQQGAAAWNNQLGQAGRRFCVQVSAADVKNTAFRKLKYAFHPPVTPPAA